MYGIPDDNPFINDDDKLDEIYAYGFRNPWYPSVDSDSGVIYSADSGQDNVQEINVVEKGKFHGWRAREGSYLFDNLIGNNGTINNPLSIGDEVLPVAEYDPLTKAMPISLAVMFIEDQQFLSLLVHMYVVIMVLYLASLEHYFSFNLVEMTH